MGIPMRKADRHYTYGDYRKWPEEERWELIEGVAWNMSPAPYRVHQKTLTRMLGTVIPFLEGKECEVYPVPFDVLLLEEGELEEDDVSSVVQPDISVICDTAKLIKKGCTGPPDWIVEITSPFTASRDFIFKLRLYEKHGVREYWMVDPGNQYVHVYILDDEGRYPADPRVVVPDEVIRCAVLDGLDIETKELFS